MTSGTAAKTERLLNLTIALLSTRRPLRKSEIRHAVPQYAECHGDSAFDRMFERDKDELRAIGVPLLTVVADAWVGSEDAYRIDGAAYALPEVDLTPAELAVLGLAARMWDQATVGTASLRAVAKLQALGIEADLDAVMGAAPRVSAAEPGFEPLYRATRERYPVSFGYRAVSGGTAVRTVEPWTLALRRGVWYLACFDRGRQAPRLFRLSRMTGPWRRAGAPGSIPAPAAAAVADALAGLDGQWTPPADEGLAMLWLRPGTAPRLRLRARAGDDPGPPPRPGYDALVVPYTDTESMAAQVARHGDSVAVAGPPGLREAVVRRWQAALDRHSGTATWAAVPPGAPSPEPTGVPPGRPPAITAVDRLSRLLAMVPYLLARPGTELSHAAAHFGVSEDQLVADLELLFVCGTPGHLPDDLIEADWAGGVVSVGNADAIARPLRLSSEEAIALLVGLDILAGIPGPHDKQAVSGARRAITGVLRGLSADEAQDTRVPVTFIGSAPAAAAPGVTDAVVAGLRHHRVVRLRYLSATRDQLTDRDVDPLELLHADGWDYLRAWCHTAGAVRTFRLDRILGAQLLDRPAVATGGGHAAPVSPPAPVRPVPAAGDVEVTLRLGSGQEWIADYFHATARGPDGEATLAVLAMGAARIERLALGSDGSVEVLTPQPIRAGIAARAAAAIAAH